MDVIVEVARRLLIRRCVVVYIETERLIDWPFVMII
jgi:hypothetical protein